MGPQAGTPVAESCSPSACWPSPLDWPPTPAVSAVAAPAEARSPGFSRPAGAPSSRRKRRADGPQVEHDADALAVAVRRLPRRFRAAGLERGGDSGPRSSTSTSKCSIFACSPGRSGQVGGSYQASPWMLRCTPPCRVPQLCPVRRIEVAYLEPEQALVEAGDGSRVGAVDGDADHRMEVVLTSTVLPDSSGERAVCLIVPRRRGPAGSRPR